MYRNRLILLLALLLSTAPALGAEPVNTENAKLGDFLAKVYGTMDAHYYLPVSRTIYEQFLKDFPAEKLMQLNEKTKKTKNFMHLGAGLLVNKLKSPADRFTSFVPSEKTKEFKSKAYAVTEDLGLEGVKKARGFEITKVQKHCQAYELGVRAGDLLKTIDGRSTTSMSEEVIKKELTPALGTKVRLGIFFQTLKALKEIQLESKSYFKETVSVEPSGIAGVLVLKVAHFNQKTSFDFADELNAYGLSQIKNLVLDLRGNEGGPPLAAREILGFFLPANDPLFAIARRKERPVLLTAPHQSLSYHGPVSILVNARTGSAAETFSGMMQAKKIATLVGQKTAGATFLKSIYDFEDGSMVFMITSLTYFYDRRVYPLDGITPDVLVPQAEDSLKIALEALR